MRKNPFISLSEVSDAVLEDARRTERTKTAAVQIVREAEPRNELSLLLHKLAENVRVLPTDVTYEDLHNFIRGIP